MSQLTTLFTDIADSLRAKEGSSGQIPAMDFPERIDGLAGKMQIVDESGEQYEVEEFKKASFHTEKVASFECRSGVSILSQDGYIYIAHDSSGLDLGDDEITFMKYSTDGELIASKYIRDISMGSSAFCFGVSGSGRIVVSDSYEGVYVINGISGNAYKVWSGSIGDLALSQAGENYFWLLYRTDDYRRLRKYKYNGSSGEAIEIIRDNVSSSVHDFYVEEETEDYYFMTSSGMTKYKKDGSVIKTYNEVKVEVIGWGDIYFLENGDFIVDNKIYSSEGTVKQTIPASRENIYINRNDTSCIYIYDGTNLCKKLIIKENGFDFVWSYEDMDVSWIVHNDDYVYVCDTNDSCAKVPTEKNSNTYLVTAEKTSGGGTLTE